jgi:AICAR transformylase/IMP cyclohydrolase PurH
MGADLAGVGCGLVERVGCVRVGVRRSNDASEQMGNRMVESEQNM